MEDITYNVAGPQAEAAQTKRVGGSKRIAANQYNNRKTKQGEAEKTEDANLTEEEKN